MIYPKFPSAGDTLGICAPSAGVGAKLESFNLSLETIADSGFKLTETKSVRNDAYPSAPADVRGAEFNSMFISDNVSMVLCASGGDYCIETLPYINQELVASKPKWFCGYSDPTAIEMLLTSKLDIATIYGFNAGGWDWRPLHEFQYNGLAVLRGEIPEQHSYEFYSSKGFDDETLTYEMDAAVKWELYTPTTSCSGDSDVPGLLPSSSLKVSGRLIGGCIDVIDCLIGTPYEDLAGFCARYAGDGLIWFFDNFALDPLQLQYALRKMQLKGLFDNARAIIIGRTLIPGEATDEDYLNQIGRVLADSGVPLIWNADVGHTKPSFTLINGAIGHFTFDNGHATLNMKLK